MNRESVGSLRSESRRRTSVRLVAHPFCKHKKVSYHSNLYFFIQHLGNIMHTLSYKLFCLKVGKVSNQFRMRRERSENSKVIKLN